MVSPPISTGKLLKNEPMTRYNSWRVGGLAEQVYIPVGIPDLSAFLLSSECVKPVNFIGLGSNVLVLDSGIKGTVIVMHNALNTLEIQDDLVFAEAGVTCAKLAKFAAANSKEGAEFFAGIPGTVGGALAMNAGCYGTETWDMVAKVMTMDDSGLTHIREKTDFVTSYRHVEYTHANEWFVGAWFAVPQGDGKASAQKIKALLAKRLASQPLNLPNAGSTFRNPTGDFAARLIEAAGLKGKQIGGAQISTKHANFIVNLGDSTAQDILDLIQLMQHEVQQQFGVELQQEVKVIGGSSR